MRPGEFALLEEHLPRVFTDEAEAVRLSEYVESMLRRVKGLRAKEQETEVERMEIEGRLRRGEKL